MFERAIALDSEYGLAYAGLADTLSWLFEWEGRKKSDLERAEKNSVKALELIPLLAESHISRGYVLTLGERYDEAELEFNQAIRLNSNSFDAYYLYGRTSFARGEIEKSEELFLKASQIRREDYQSLLLLGQSQRVLGKKDESQVALREGVSNARKQLAINPTDRRILSFASNSLLEIGEREEAHEWINKAMQLYPEDAGVLINAACFFAKDRNKEKALSILELAFSKGYGDIKWISHDPDYDSLRDEPRFKALLSQKQLS